MASTAWAWLGFFWASSGLLLLGFFCFFFFWCLGFFFFWRLAVPPASDWRLPFHSFLPFFMGGGASSSRPRGHRPRPTKVSGHVPRCVTASVGVSSAGPSLLWRGETRAIQCRVAQGTGSLEHPCLAGVIPCCCPKRAHLIAARSATCGRWSGGCLIERRRQTLRFPVLACRLPRPLWGAYCSGRQGGYERVVANLG